MGVYYSADNGASWQPVTFPASVNVLQGTATVGLVAAGHHRQPAPVALAIHLQRRQLLTRLTDLSIGAGHSPRHLTADRANPLRQRALPRPVRNIRSDVDRHRENAPWPSQRDATLQQDDAVPLVDYTNPLSGLTPPLLWDAGSKLLSKGSDARLIYYNPAGTISPFTITTTSIATLRQKLLPSSGGRVRPGARQMYRCLRNTNGGYA